MGPQTTRKRRGTHLLPLELHDGAGSVHAVQEGGRRVVLVVHGHGEGHQDLLLARARAHRAGGHQLILLPALAVQGPPGAHLQAVGGAAEGQVLTCAKQTRNPSVTGAGTTALLPEAQQELRGSGPGSAGTSCRTGCS